MGCWLLFSPASPVSTHGRQFLAGNHHRPPQVFSVTCPPTHLGEVRGEEVAGGEVALVVGGEVEVRGMCRSWCTPGSQLQGSRAHHVRPEPMYVVSVQSFATASQCYSWGMRGWISCAGLPPPGSCVAPVAPVVKCPLLRVLRSLTWQGW
jgi:hypothetical protein